MDYKLVSHVRIECFDERVKRFLILGWELYGFPFSNGASICQAMVKKDDPDSCINSHSHSDMDNQNLAQ